MLVYFLKCIFLKVVNVKSEMTLPLEPVCIWVLGLPFFR